MNNTQNETGNEQPSALDYAPRQYSFRSSLATTVKLLLACGVFVALIWALDLFLTHP